MWLWLVRLLGGWIPTGSKPFGEYIGKIIWVVGIVLAVLFVWDRFTRPTNDIKVTAGGTYNEAPQGMQATFGCASGRQFLGWAHQKDKNVK